MTRFEVQINLELGGRFGYIYIYIYIFFFCSGRGIGESEAPEGGGRFLLKISGGGEEGGVEGPGGCLRRIGEFFLGGAKYFFFGAETSTKKPTF